MKVIQTGFKYSSNLIPLSIPNIKYIILHHVAATSATPEQIHQWHLDNKWAGFGYNEYIRKDGTVYIGRGDNVGAQCSGMNSKSYGICCEGDYNKEMSMPEAQLKSLIERIRVNKQRFPNLLSIETHKKFYATDCPGKYFPMTKILNQLKTPNNSPANLSDDVSILASNGIISIPEYWLQNAVSGKSVKGEDVATLIHRFADKLR